MTWIFGKKNNELIMPDETRTRAEKKLDDSLKDINDQLKTIIGKIRKIEGELRNQNEKLEGMELIIQEIVEFKQDLKEVKAENLVMKKKMTDLEMELDQIKNDANRSKIELTGIPEVAGENLKAVVNKLATLGKVDLKEADIKSVIRSKTRNSRPGIISVEFVQAITRDEFMKKVKQRKPIQHDIGFTGNDKVFINEKLTVKAKTVLYHVKVEAKNKNWSSVWTYAGQVYIKIESQGQPILIKNLDDLEILSK